ncbi:MAG: hypothetical protein WC793_00545 [Candidatus Paceibacterota bacterium]|jgi:hypothetical protein
MTWENNLKKNIVVILLLFFSLLPVNNIHAQNSNVGFVPGNIWYSKDPFEEGDKIKIYALVFNPDNRELSGTVVFFDNDVFLAKKDFVAPAKGIKDISVDWTANVGTHNIFGKIENAKFLISAGKYEEVFLAENETSKSVRTVTKKITTNTTDTSKNANSILDTISTASTESTKTIQKIVGENTPKFISDPIVSTTNAVEQFRTDVGTSSDNKKAEVQSQIKALDAVKTDTSKSKSAPNTNTQSNSFLKPFKYIELFFFTFLSFVVNNPFIFYGSILVILFYILRALKRLIFN